MSEEQRELFFDLLTKKAVFGLDEVEQKHLDDFNVDEDELLSLEMTAAAITLTHVENQPMPAHLEALILADSQQYVGSPTPSEAWPPRPKSAQTERSGNWLFGWLGWGAAIAAGLALAFNIYTTRVAPTQEIARGPAPIETPRIPTLAEMRTEMLATTVDLTRAEWAAGNVKEAKITGDVVWSDDKQSGYMRFSGLPVNDATTTCYQLWIFDKTQDKAKPIDGGIFDVNSQGEVIVPINAKLKAEEPYMFAVTVERHGGVVVSDREKIVALANVEARKPTKS